MELVQWHWLVLGMCLIALEALGTGGFLIGGAIAAFIMALLTHLMVLTWEWQVISFSVLALIMTTIFWKFFKKASKPDRELNINDRAGQLVGRIVVLNRNLVSPGEKIQIGDTLWKVDFEGQFSEGERVKVVGSEQMTLKIEKAD